MWGHGNSVRDYSYVLALILIHDDEFVWVVQESGADSLLVS